MKRRTALPDLLLLSGTLFAAFVLVATIQRITGRLDGVASMVFLLGAFLVSLYTEGYFWGVAASLLGVLAACLGPFVRLGVQYLLYKLTAFLAGMTAAPELAKLIDALGGVFGLMLGMTGSCALLLLISISSAILVVTP